MRIKVSRKKLKKPVSTECVDSSRAPALALALVLAPSLEPAPALVLAQSLEPAPESSKQNYKQVHDNTTIANFLTLQQQQL
jgi:hypothetical protein